MNTSSRERLSDYLITNGLSKASFYKKTGISNGYLDKKGAIGSKLLRKISGFYPEIDLHWVITGESKLHYETKILSDHLVLKEDSVAYNLKNNKLHQLLIKDRDRLIKTVQEQETTIKELVNMVNNMMDDNIEILEKQKGKAEK